MLENRPIVAITIGYLIGIIMGLYFNYSIVLLYLIFYLCLILKKPPIKKFKLISIKRYFRYVKIFLCKKVLIIILISSVISNTIVLYKNKQYEDFLSSLNMQEIQLKAKVISNEKINQFNKTYIIISNNKKFYLNVNKNAKIQYGDYIQIKGTFSKPKERTNYKGFDYKEYLKSQGIYGTIKCKEVQIINKKKEFFNQIFLKVKRLIQRDFEKNISNVLLGTILGYTDEINENIKESFSKSNISHILAVSGMHIGYLIIFCTFIFDKIFGKRLSFFLSILIVLFYVKIIGYSPSAIRAVIMAIMLLSSKLLYRKSDVWTNLSLSLLCILIYNPFSIKSIGLLLSYTATFGIVVYSKNIRFRNKIFNAIGITISAMIFISPIMSICFNKISILSLIISFLVGIIAGPIVFLGLIYIVLGNFLKLNLTKTIINLLVKKLLFLANIGSKIPLNQIHVVTPNLLEIFIFYILVFITFFFISIYKPKRKQNKVFNKRIRNLINLAKYEFYQNKRRVLSFMLIIAIFANFIIFIPKNLKIFFIDVGQGDSCLIVTPNNKKILIDGGGSEIYDVGKNVLVPYLLARRIKRIDYMMISHFDTDHVGGLLTVMEELKVDTAIVSKQAESCENYEKFIQIAKEKHIKVMVVGKGDRLKIERDLYFDILWPKKDNLISENDLNNNSIVCKFKYKDFSMLFTGDIEEIAEKQILQEYKDDLDKLNSTILKVGHHGSKSSSIQEFIDSVKPRFALIGVGANNTFGHPNEGVIERLKSCDCKIYRTDKNGEICIEIDGRDRIKFKKFIK
ncbi:MAG: DNA internalization-related competence protein ComEC/Rec2 [Clostridia bacterium]|nr:DNA internalization-related competence protein ComEC/Rec2 [Clostridia bacterium]